MEVDVVVVPYDSGQRNARMGAGPQQLLERVVKPLLGNRATSFRVHTIEASEPFQAEIATAFELNRRVAERVREVVREEGLPLVLSGNCNIAIGTTSAVVTDPPGVIWFDAHADFNTPETTTSGFFDGMGLAVLAGQCWQRMAAAVPGFRAIPGGNILHIGVRDLSDAGLENMQSCGVQVCGAEGLETAAGRAELSNAMERLRARSRNVYVHLDLDVIARSEGEANEFSPPGGLASETVADILRAIRETFDVSAVGVASYDPACDEDGRIAAAAGRLLSVLLQPPAAP